jgi:hypothetical protein
MTVNVEDRMKRKSLTIATRTRVKLPEAEYHKFKALVGATHGIELEALKAAEQFKQRAGEAQAKCSAYFVELAARHGFDSTRIWRWDDETLELIALPPTGAPGAASSGQSEAEGGGATTGAAPK